jgi:hypothetical protein
VEHGANRYGVRGRDHSGRGIFSSSRIFASCRAESGFAAGLG